jgi:hypothetical protein
MKIQKKLVETVDFLKFADDHNLNLLVIEASPREMKRSNSSRFSVSFTGVGITGNPDDDYGSGSTPWDALKDYAVVISEETLIILDENGEQKETIKVPVLTTNAYTEGKFLDSLREATEIEEEKE